MGTSQSEESDGFIKYNKAIWEFEKLIEKLENNNDNTNKKFKGYLIDFEDFEKFKECLNYEQVKYNFKNNNDKIDNFKTNEFQNIKKIKNQKFKSFQHFLDNIKDKKKYVLINEELWNIIGDNSKNEEPIFFSVKNQKIILNFDDINKVAFKFDKKNNINSNLLLSVSIDELLDSIIEYYNFENKFYFDLQIKKSNPESLYLVDKKWIDKWKYFTNYEYIKMKYLNNTKKIDDNIKKRIKNDITSHQNKYKNIINIFNYNQMELLNFEKKEQLEEYLKYNNSLAIINFKLICFFKNEYNKKLDVKMTIEDHKIKMLLNNGEKSFNSNDNTIILENKNNFFEGLKAMIKFHCFNQKIKQLIQRPYSELPNNQKGTKVAYLINK